MHRRVLLYGDATAHLAIARRIVDSATPGLSQLGTVWLPLPHLLMAPLVVFMPLWRNGLAGAVPSLIALVLGAWLLHRLVKRAFGSGAAAWAALFYCLNPSLLYLSAVPMTESIYLATFLGLVDQVGAYWSDADPKHIGRAGAWGLAASLCRYDGWFILPFALAALVLKSRQPSAISHQPSRVPESSRRGAKAWATTWRFCIVAGNGPVFWFAYNWFYFGNPLAFLNGPYSAKAIAGAASYPGDHALGIAALYYFKDVALTVGVPLGVLALIGFVFGRRWRRQPVAWLLLLPLPWYLWAMWSGNVPIFVPQYWPHGYYNLRYGVQLLPAVTLFSGLVVAALWRAVRRLTLMRGSRAAAGVAVGLAILCGAAYAEMLRAPGPPAYAEAVHNATARLAMEQALARALAPWQPGQKVLMFYGTYPGALADDGIPLHEVIQEANFHLWQHALAAPHTYVQWVVIESDSPTARLVNRADLRQYFTGVVTLQVPTQHSIEVFRRK
ncbi:MAG: hypothetical protein EPN33_10285 [Acidobacteria bacterium]|nr:MAG: hypothetical protein EPN33_10285 [Acidobacteriota bacterium]